MTSRLRWRVGVDVYNLLNSDDVVTQRNSTADSPSANFGRLLGQPSVIWDARFWKLSTRLQW